MTIMYTSKDVEETNFLTKPIRDVFSPSPVLSMVEVMA